jgi:hypothetical protein
MFVDFKPAMIKTPSDAQMSLMKEMQELLHGNSVAGFGSGGEIFTYSGPLDTSSIEAILSLTEKAISQCRSPREELKSAISVVHECLKNVIVHGWIDSKGETLVYLTLEYTTNGLRIQMGNFVDELMSARLQSKLEEINTLDRSDLRKKSVELLCVRENNTPSLSDSPGLGLINMAASCELPLKYDFKQVDHNLKLFTLTTIVNN